MRIPPLRAVVLTLTRAGGPQPTLDIDWTRTTIRVYDTGAVYRRVEAFMPNRQSRMAIRSSGWLRVKRTTVEDYRREGFVPLEVSRG